MIEDHSITPQRDSFEKRMTTKLGYATLFLAISLRLLQSKFAFFTIFSTSYDTHKICNPESNVTRIFKYYFQSWT